MTIFSKSLNDQVIEAFFLANKKCLEDNYSGIKKYHLINFFRNRKLKEVSKIKSLLLEGVPLEYIQNRKFFYQNDFFVNTSVLIPRNETEILVEMVINEINKYEKEDIEIIDVGSGSGCIGLSIAIESHNTIKLTLSDIDPNALKTANKNIEKLSYNLSHTYVETLEMDRLYNIDKQFDFIVSNPPYIKKTTHKELVHQKTHEFEPHTALYLKDSEYNDWFDTFFKQIHLCSKPNTLVFLELHEDTIDELKLRFENYFNKVEIISDLTNRNRFLRAECPK